jgi:hypothetical protein
VVLDYDEAAIGEPRSYLQVHCCFGILGKWPRHGNTIDLQRSCAGNTHAIGDCVFGHVPGPMPLVQLFLFDGGD